MRIIARRTLSDYVATLTGHKDQTAVKRDLDAWFNEVRKADGLHPRMCETPSPLSALWERTGSSSTSVATAIGWSLPWTMSDPQSGSNGSELTKTMTISTSGASSMVIEIKPIRTDADHKQAMAEIDRLWGASAGSVAGDQLDVLITLVDAYEARCCPIDPPDPVAAIEFRMEQQGLTRADLVARFGRRSHILDVLDRKRALTLSLIRRLRDELGISADVLIGRSR
jgi:HTH-type transcriptional regulator / antitoxin HigA